MRIFLFLISFLFCSFITQQAYAQSASPQVGDACAQSGAFLGIIVVVLLEQVISWFATVPIGLV
jgi:hypothetical protein